MTDPAIAGYGDKLLYKVEEAGALLSLGKSKTWELVLRGDLGSVKIDGSRRVPRKAIDAFLSQLSSQ